MKIKKINKTGAEKAKQRMETANITHKGREILKRAIEETELKILENQKWK